MTHDDRIEQLVARGALFVFNHSGGKDSQAMTIEVVGMLRSAGLTDAELLERVVVIHADLGEVEWTGNLDHIRATCADTLRCAPEEVPLVVAEPVNRDGNRKSLLDVVEARGMWPDKKRRWCTSDFKRGPIEREIRRAIKARGLSGLVVSCIGMRADESPDRAKLTPFAFSERNSKAGREWHDWLPIFERTTDEVFTTIEAAGQEPHWAYAAGMSRLSCSFCVFASASDLRTAARLRPELYARYVELERRIGHTFSMSRKPLEEVTGISVRPPVPTQLPLFQGRESLKVLVAA